MTSSKFKNELKKQTRLAIAAAIGFIIAFAWRDFIIQITDNALARVMNLSPATSTLITAITLTIIGVILIFISSKALE